MNIKILIGIIFIFMVPVVGIADEKISMYPRLFGTIEFSGLPQKSSQWYQVFTNIDDKLEALTNCTLDENKCFNNNMYLWRGLQLKAQNQNRIDQLYIVNNFFNQWPYKSDIEVYNKDEYWASPIEFMTNSGDCEDYAIAKYFALRQLGFSETELRIVIVYDRIKNVGHAVLAVYNKNKIWILDNRSNFIATDTKYKFYIPQYSMNETTRWGHIDPNYTIPETILRVND